MQDSITITLTFNEAKLMIRLLDAMHIAASAKRMAGLVDSDLTDQIECVAFKIYDALMEESRECAEQYQ